MHNHLIRIHIPQITGMDIDKYIASYFIQGCISVIHLYNGHLIATIKCFIPFYYVELWVTLNVGPYNYLCFIIMCNYDIGLSH